MIITTEDLRKISVRHLAKGSDTAIILAHGFYNNKDTYLFKAIAEMLHKHYDVVTFDFRGHGKSNGLFSWTAYEPQDLRAVISFAKKKGYKKIGVIGFSLGAATTLIELSQNPILEVKSIIAVSPPYDFWKIDFRFWEHEMLNDLKLNLGPKGKGKGVHPGNPFLRKIRPIDAVTQVSDCPVLFIHGEKDWLIKPYHSERLFAVASQPKKLKIIPDAGHAEKIFDKFPDAFEQLCVEWFEKTITV